MSTLISIPAQEPAGATNTSRTLTLDGVQVRIVIKLIKPAGAWYLDTFDANDAPIVTGLRICAGVDLWGAYHGYSGIPAGALFASWQGTGAAQDPGETTFADGDAQIFYLAGGVT